MGRQIVSTQHRESDYGFFRYADAIAQPLAPQPLRQILSLMRVQGVDFLVDEWEEDRLPLSPMHEKCDAEWQQRVHSHNVAASYRSRRFSFFRGVKGKDPFSPDWETASITFDVDKLRFEELCQRAEDPLLVCLGELTLHTLLGNDGVPLSSFVYEAIVSHPPVDREHHFVHSVALFSREVLGHVFDIEGSFFAQQGGALSSCAHAAVRVCLTNIETPRKGAVDFRYDLLYEQYSERYAGTTEAPRVGLSNEEIQYLLNKNLSTVKLKWEALSSRDEEGTIDEDGARSVITSLYYTVESGLPAILIFKSRTPDPANPEDEAIIHAMAVIGHTFDGNLWQGAIDRTYFKNGPEDAYLPSHKWVQGLIVQDDNFGPYCTLPRNLLFDKEPEVCLPYFPWSRLLPQAVEIHCSCLVAGDKPSNESREKPLIEKIAAWFHEEKRDVPYWFGVLSDHIAKKEHVLRTVPCTREMYLNFLNDNEIAPKESAALHHLEQVLSNARCLWMVEISVPELYHRSNRRLGEFLVVDGPSKDYTGTPVPHCLATRFPGVLCTFSPIDADSGGVAPRYFSTEKTLHYPIWKRPPNVLAELIE